MKVNDNSLENVIEHTHSFASEDIRSDVKSLMTQVGYLPFNMGRATLSIESGIDNLLHYFDIRIGVGESMHFIEVLFEAIEYLYISIGAVRPDSRTFSFSWNNPSRDAMFETLKDSELFGMVGLYMKSKNIQDCRDSLIEKLGVFAYCNRGMGQFVDFYDSHIAMLADCAASDIERIAEQLR